MDKSFKLKVKTDEKSLTQTSGNFTIQPLDRGYGITLGNAMRRVLLTSIPGAAITHVKIEGVDHEFSSIEGVKDDVADIIMNLKKVRFKLMDNNPDKVNLSLKGKKIVTAQDIQTASDQFEILNKDDSFYNYHKNLAFKKNLKVFSFGINNKSSMIYLKKITLFSITSSRSTSMRFLHIVIICKLMIIKFFFNLRYIASA